MTRTVIFLIILTAFAYSQQMLLDGDVLSESAISPRAAGMGRAYTAVSSEASGLCTNPAALGSIKANNGIIAGRLDFGNINIEPSNIFDSKSLSARRGGNLGLSYLGFTVPITTRKSNLVSSIIVRNMADLNDQVTWTIIDDATDSQYDRDENRSGGLFSLSGGMGIDILADLSLGTSIHFITGEQDYTRSTRTDVSDNATERDTTWSNKFSGLSIELGIIWRPSRIVSFGSRIIFPHTIHYSDLEETSESAAFSVESQVDYSLKKPTIIATGIALHLSRVLLFTCDYVHRPWEEIETKWDGKNVNHSHADASSIHLGMEFIFESTNLELPIRAGYFSLPEQLFEPASKNQVSSHYLTGGIGLGTEQINFDLSVNYRILQYTIRMPELSAKPLELNSSDFQITLGMGVEF